MTEPELRESRQRYNIAHAVHQTNAQAVSNARVGGASPSKTLLDSEADAARMLANARRRLLMAITAVINAV